MDLRKYNHENIDDKLRDFKRITKEEINLAEKQLSHKQKQVKLIRDLEHKVSVEKNKYLKIGYQNQLEYAKKSKISSKEEYNSLLRNLRDYQSEAQILQTKHNRSMSGVFDKNSGTQGSDDL